MRDTANRSIVALLVMGLVTGPVTGLETGRVTGASGVTCPPMIRCAGASRLHGVSPHVNTLVMTLKK